MVEDIFRKPTSGAETSLFNMAYNAINLYYLYHINQLDSGIMENVLDHLNLGMYIHSRNTLPVIVK